MSHHTVNKILLVVSLAVTSSATTFAETMWLSDELWVNVRTGPSTSNQILKAITSGTRMETIEQPEGSEYWLVRTEDGLEGWVPWRYLDDEPTGDIKAANLEVEIQQLRSQYDTLNTKYTDLLANKGDVNGELESLRENNLTLTQELNRIRAVSENAITLDKQYQQLAEQNARLENELDVVSAENRSLKEYNDNQSLYIGGGLIVIGIILGSILPRLGGRRRKDSWS